jgi:hypothetical protein
MSMAGDQDRVFASSYKLVFVQIPCLTDNRRLALALGKRKEWTIFL